MKTAISVPGANMETDRPGLLARAKDVQRRWVASALTAAGNIGRAITPTRRLKMGFLVSHTYQRPYIESLFETANSLPDIDCRQLLAPQDSNRLGLVEKFAGFDYVFHSRPFQTGAFLRRDIGHVLVMHGPTSGYFDAMGGFAFGRGRLLDSRQRPIYSHVFVPLEWDKEMAEQEVPEYIGRIHVVGCKRLDRIFAHRHRRPEIRASFGVGPDDKCVVVASTHSGRSLLSNHLDGVERLLAAECPSVKYQVVVHPYAQSNSPERFGRLQELCARRPQQVQIADQSRLEELLVAADLMISDHGSLSLYYAALDKPLAYVDLDPNLLPNSPLMTIHRSSYQLRDPWHARPLIRSLLDGSLRSRINPQHVQRLRSGAGNYDELARKAILALASRTSRVAA